MSILKKFKAWRRKKEEEKKKRESWYNQDRNKERKAWNEPHDYGLCDSHQLDNTIANQIRK